MTTDYQYTIDVAADAEADAWMKANGHEWGDVLSAAQLLKRRNRELTVTDTVINALADVPPPPTRYAKRNGRPKQSIVTMPFRQSVRDLLRDGRPRTKADICTALKMTDHAFRHRPWRQRPRQGAHRLEGDHQ